jgi:hypothetical protein
VPRRISGPAGGIGGDPAAPDREAAESERSDLDEWVGRGSKT